VKGAQHSISSVSSTSLDPLPTCVAASAPGPEAYNSPLAHLPHCDEQHAVPLPHPHRGAAIECADHQATLQDEACESRGRSRVVEVRQAVRQMGSRQESQPPSLIQGDTCHGTHTYEGVTARAKGLAAECFHRRDEAQHAFRSMIRQQSGEQGRQGRQGHGAGACVLCLSYHQRARLRSAHHTLPADAALIIPCQALLNPVP
jgi:hypothetical protein